MFKISVLKLLNVLTGISASATCRTEGEAAKATVQFISRAMLDQQNSLFSRIPIIGITFCELLPDTSKIDFSK